MCDNVVDGFMMMDEVDGKNDNETQDVDE